MRPRILLVEDTPTEAELARAHLAAFGHECDHADSVARALEAAAAHPPDAVLIDLQLPDGSGFDLMRRLRQAGVNAAFIVITVNASVKAAVEAMREGAVDFIVKPYSRARLRVTLDNALETRRLRAELEEARAQLGRAGFHGFVGASPAMQAVYRTIESVAGSKASVFVTGESGTGKELAADAIHRSSPRAGKPFVALNCAAIPRDLLESEIFGHVKGAFTGATENRAGAAKAADGGTLFLDEIGEMPLDMQVKLLRFLQLGSFTPVGGTKQERVDVRIIAATNRDIRAEVQAGRFREDLFYRLYVVPLELPPLRAREDDVVLVARHFLSLFAAEEGRAFQGIDPEAEDMIRDAAWPGNVRQLQNVVRNIVVLNDGPLVTPAMLPAALIQPRGPDGAPAAPARVERRARPVIPLAEVEKTAILAALEHTRQDVPRAAALLEVNPSTIYRKLAAWKKGA